MRRQARTWCDDLIPLAPANWALKIGGLVARPGLYFSLLPVNHNARAEDVVAFLEELRGQLRGPFVELRTRPSRSVTFINCPPAEPSRIG